MSVVFNLGIIFQLRTSFRLKSSIVGISLWNIELIARFMRINDWPPLDLFNIGKTNLHVHGVFVINWLCLYWVQFKLTFLLRDLLAFKCDFLFKYSLCGGRYRSVYERPIVCKPLNRLNVELVMR